MIKETYTCDCCGKTTHNTFSCEKCEKEICFDCYYGKEQLCPTCYEIQIDKQTSNKF